MLLQECDRETLATLVRGRRLDLRMSVPCFARLTGLPVLLLQAVEKQRRRLSPELLFALSAAPALELPPLQLRGGGVCARVCTSESAVSPLPVLDGCGTTARRQTRVRACRRPIGEWCQQVVLTAPWREEPATAALDALADQLIGYKVTEVIAALYRAAQRRAWSVVETARRLGVSRRTVYVHLPRTTPSETRGETCANERG